MTGSDCWIAENYILRGKTVSQKILVLFSVKKDIQVAAFL